MKTTSILRLVLGSTWVFGLLVAFIAAPGLSGTAQAQAVCPPFPSMPWLGTMTHEKVTAFVERRHAGEWDSYIGQWQSRIGQMEDVHNAGKGIRLKSRDVTLSGDGLKYYIAQMRRSISVMSCLRDQDRMTAESLSNMSTAAGQDNQQSFEIRLRSGY
ncbi:MAG: hypothetical protein ACPGOV_03270 [Magnetovibrionaceae bacterium]